MSKLLNKTSKKAIGFILALLVLVSGVFFYNDFGINTDDHAKAASPDKSIIRVLLSTMGSQKSVAITVNGTYSVKNITNTDYSFRNGVLLRKKTYTFSVVDGNIVLSCDGNQFVLGSDITLYSHKAGRDNYLTMSNKSYGVCNYIGNMRLYVSAGCLVFINELNLDDYLCGVVPYEMSEAQAVESLKVQAVCARSFAYYKVASNPNNTYHVNDTVATQVYRGYKAQYPKCITAVDQTAYQVLTYNGKYISTYYSSSNGGITESTANAWWANLPYYTVQVDEYDTAYQNRRYTLSKTSIYAKNATNLKAAAKTEIENKGYDYSTAEVLSIDHLIPTYQSEPKELAETERRVASLEIQITVNAMNATTQTYETFTCSVKTSKESVRTFLLLVNPDGIDGRILPSTRFKVEENDTEIVVTARGNGHGIGMSQNGVYGRVNAGHTYSQILAFYFTGTEIKTLQYDTYIFDPTPSNEYIDSQTDSFALYEEPKSGSVNKSTTVHENAGAIYSIIAQVTANSDLQILGESADWYSVSTNDGAVSGYIRKSCVTIKKEEVPDNPNGILKVGQVTQDVWARSSAEYIEGNLLKKLSVGSEVIVLNDKSPFYEIYYDGDAPAYVSKEYVKLTDETVYSISKANVTAYKASLFSKADESSEKNGYLPKGAEIEIFNIAYGFAGCIYNGTVSYIKFDKIDIAEDKYGYIVPRESTAIDVNLKITVVTDIYNTSDETGSVVDKLLQNDVVRAVMLTNNRYKIVYGDGYAYIKCDDAVIYSENITVERVVAVADKILYSSGDMSVAVGILSAGDALEVISADDDIIIAHYCGTICYMTADNVNFTTEEATVIK